MVTLMSDLSWMFEPISAELYDALPIEICQRIEVVDGMVQMNPAPLGRHQKIARLIADAIDAGGLPNWQTLLDIDLRIKDDPLHNRRPDVTVCGIETSIDEVVPASAALAVVEVVSPGSMTVDRLHKPAIYALAKIRYYWRVEIVEGMPVLYAYKLDREAELYRPVGVFQGKVSIDLGFPVEIDFTRLPPRTR
jgi:Uma2 family endonuclease